MQLVEVEVMRLGLDGMMGVGSVTLAIGGLAMVAAIALGFATAASLVLPVASACWYAANRWSAACPNI